MAEGTTTKDKTRAEANELLDRVERILSMTPEARHNMAEKVLGSLPPPVRMGIWKLAAALSFGATGLVSEHEALNAIIKTWTDEQGKGHVQAITDVMALVIVTCTHGIALEVDESEIKQIVKQARATTFDVRGTADEAGVPHGTKWDGGPDGKGH